MKLAEALIERANLQRRLDALKARMNASARVQAGDTPAEDAMALLNEYERIAADLLDVIRRINATNAAAEIETGVSLVDAIVVRDLLRKRQQAYADLADAAMGKTERYFTAPEPRYARVVDVAVLRKQADELGREARELDTRLQGANWTINLI
ncbi:DIP1984 family protein [Caldilinea sp.]|uniref:DIP1984 family protein n=1 Tax=Caldilinea sp. TaxID=2293560 RepID=UPI002B8EEDDA|nr:DIP1984 family protein [Anaerolineales bacterium]HQY95194.1 DIP1984 family protein [Caldilinea sp.]